MIRCFGPEPGKSGLPLEALRSLAMQGSIKLGLPSEKTGCLGRILNPTTSSTGRLFPRTGWAPSLRGPHFRKLRVFVVGEPRDRRGRIQKIHKVLQCFLCPFEGRFRAALHRAASYNYERFPVLWVVSADVVGQGLPGFPCAFYGTAQESV